MVDRGGSGRAADERDDDGHAEGPPRLRTGPADGATGLVRVWVDLRQGRASWQDVIDAGLVVVQGHASSVENLRRIFHLG